MTNAQHDLLARLRYESLPVAQGNEDAKALVKLGLAAWKPYGQFGRKRLYITPDGMRAVRQRLEEVR